AELKVAVEVTSNATQKKQSQLLLEPALLQTGPVLLQIQEVMLANGPPSPSALTAIQ
ncbi:unnamed protein product, partial [marine sediment metagenome]